MQDVDGLNSGFARALLEQYLENPEAVPAEWRSLFESGSSDVVATHPALARLLELAGADGNGHAAAPPPLPPPSRAEAPPAAPAPRELDRRPEPQAAVPGLVCRARPGGGTRWQ